MIKEDECDLDPDLFPLDNFKLHLRYEGWFDNPKMLNDLKKKLETSTRTIEFWSFKPDIGPKTGWKHTHVLLICKGAAFRHRNTKFFIVEGVTPFIRKIKSEEHLAEVIAYHKNKEVGEENWSHFPLIGDGVREKIKKNNVSISMKAKLLKEVKEEAFKCPTEQDLMSTFEGKSAASDWGMIRGIWKSKPLEKKPPGPDISSWYLWKQERVLETISAALDACRKIIVYIDKYGASGKTDLRKYFIRYVEKTLLLPTAHIYHLSTNIEKHVARGEECKHIIFDIEADTKISTGWYAALESIKSGQITSVKNNGKMIDFGTPHITIFTNSLPHLESLIPDRWDIRFIGEDKTIERRIDGQRDLCPIVKEHDGDRKCLASYWDEDEYYKPIPRLRYG